MTFNDCTLVFLSISGFEKPILMSTTKNAYLHHMQKHYVTQRKDIHVKPSNIVQQAQCSPHESNNAAQSHRHSSLITTATQPHADAN